MEEAKTKIKQVVASYKQLFYNEYLATVNIVKQKRKGLLKEVGTMSKGVEFLERPLVEYPERLFNLLNVKLTPQEMVFFSTVKGTQWFAQTFKEFALIKKI